MVMSALMRPSHIPAPRRVNLLRFLTGTINLESGKVIQTRLIATNQCPRDDIPKTNDRIDFKSNHTTPESARHVFDQMNKQGVSSTYNPTLVELVEKGFLDEASNMLRRMLAENMMWNKDAYVGAFVLCAGLKDLNLGRQVHNKLLTSDVEFDASLCSAMINMYGDCKDITSARKVFDMSKDQNVVSMTEMMAAYSQNGFHEDSLNLFFNMQYEDVIPDESTFLVLLKVSAELFSMKCGKSVHALADKFGFQGHKHVVEGLIDMYSRTGDIKAAQNVFLGMTDYRDIVTWNAMMHAYCLHGLGKEALDLYDEMLKFGEDPDYVTFVGVLNACGHLGRVDKGFYYLYELMKQKGVEPGFEHYMCMLNILIRAGHVDEALKFMVSAPIKLDAGAWSNLLTACRAHRNYTLGTRVIELIPDDVASKVSKLCGVTEVRELMEVKNNIKVEHGLSWVQIKDRTYIFDSVDKGDSRFGEVHEIVRPFFACIKANAYWPQWPDHHTGNFDNVEEDCVGYHSEKLAVAYAVLKTHKLAPICIIKESGKLCDDCHDVMKLVSKVSNKLITVRDANQFHNFHDGSCSCADHW